MSDLQLLKETFQPKPFEKHMTDFKDWKSDRGINIQLIIQPELKERALDYCKAEQINQLPSGELVVNMPFVEGEMGYNFILGLGHKCEVKSPPNVRHEIARRASLLANLYSQ